MTIVEQKRYFLNLVEDLLERGLADKKIDEAGLRRVLDLGNYFQDDLMKIIQKILALNFADRWSVSNYQYPESYRIKSIEEQLLIIERLFPGIGKADEKIIEQPLPVNAEGWFAVVNWRKLSPDYSEAVRKLLAAHAEKMKSEKDFKLEPAFIRRSYRTDLMMRQISDKQNNADILILPAQFGLLYRCHAACCAIQKFSSREFGLGSFEVLCMLLTHPQREQQEDQLHVMCPGDEVDVWNIGNFCGVSFVDAKDGVMRFNSIRNDMIYTKFGSVSAFLL